MSDQEQHWSFLPSQLTRNGLDSLREHGTSFTNYHCVTVPCGPSRSTIYTGLHTQDTRVVANPSNSNGVSLATGVQTLGAMLRAEGYYTAYKGKWHLSAIPRPSPFTETSVGVLDEYGFAEYSTDGDCVGVAWDGFTHDPAIASEAAAWLLGNYGDRPEDRPWFLAVNFINPHDVMFFDATSERPREGGRASRPRLWPPPRTEIYTRRWDAPLPDSISDGLHGKPETQRLRRDLWSRYVGDIASSDEQAWSRYRDYYYNCLVDLDRNVEIVLQALRGSDVYENTMVIYTSDHGEAAGAHGLRGKPVSIYREVVKVPLVISHPDARTGTTTPALAATVDIAPTVLAAAGLSDSARAERYGSLAGHSLLPVVVEPNGGTERDATGVLFNMSVTGPWNVRAEMVAQAREDTEESVARGYRPRHSSERPLLRGIFDGRWKFARYFGPHGHNRYVSWEQLLASNDLELYDTELDPDEVDNLAYVAAHRREVVRLAQATDRLIAEEVGDDDGAELVRFLD